VATPFILLLVVALLLSLQAPEMSNILLLVEVEVEVGILAGVVVVVVS
jgi:hypothetical protein